MIGARSGLSLVVAALGLLSVVDTGQAQFGQGRNAGRSSDIDFDEFNVAYDGRFTFVRLRYTPLPGFAPGGYFGPNLKWDHDYPRAERHLMRILSELTALDPHAEGSNILAVDDPELFKYPFAYMAEPGYWTLTSDEAESLRAYLLKGGFLIVDDFAGGRDWMNFENRMQQVLPDARLIELDVSHPLFHSFFDIDALDHRHPYRGYKSIFYGVFEDNDPEKRLMVIVNYNNDIGESWEYSDRGFIPIDLSNEAYKLGVNYIVYAMTH